MTPTRRSPVGRLLGRGRRDGWRFVGRRVVQKRVRQRRSRTRAFGAAPVAWIESDSIDPARGSGRVVHPNEEILISLPPDLDPWLVDAPGWHTRHGIPAQRVVEIRDGWVFGDVGHVGLDPQTVCRDLNQGIHQQPEGVAREVAAACDRGVEELPGTTVSGLVLGGTNYFHWMTQGLPRLAMVLAATDLAEVDRILTPAGPAFLTETLARIGAPSDKIVPVDAAAPTFRAERLIAGSTPPSWSPTPTWAIETVRAAFAAERGSAGTGERFYLRRLGRGRDRRRVLNEEAVMAMLADLGFRTVSTEDLTVAAQAALFAGADVVVGLHGAGLTNLVFCHPGARVIEILPANAAVASYHLLARQAGIDHHPVVGIEARPPRWMRTYLTDADAIVDVPALQRLLVD